MMSDDEVLSVLLSANGDEVRRSLRDRGPNTAIDGRAVLLWVRSVGDLEAAATLISMGADPNVRADTGETALLLAGRRAARAAPCELRR